MIMVKNIYDKERITYESKTEKTTSLKMISILVTINANIINILNKKIFQIIYCIV